MPPRGQRHPDVPKDQPWGPHGDNGHLGDPKDEPTCPKGDIAVSSTINPAVLMGTKDPIDGLKWGIFEQKIRDFQLNGGFLGVKMRDFQSNG